jgi:hypothetical protein
LGNQGSNSAPHDHVDANTAAPKQRKKRSDAGVKHKSGTSASADTPATSASTDAPVKQRKKRSDFGIKRGTRS